MKLSEYINIPKKRSVTKTETSRQKFLNTENNHVKSSPKKKGSSSLTNLYKQFSRQSFKQLKPNIQLKYNIQSHRYINKFTQLTTKRSNFETQILKQKLKQLEAKQSNRLLQYLQNKQQSRQRPQNILHKIENIVNDKVKQKFDELQSQKRKSVKLFSHIGVETDMSFSTKLISQAIQTIEAEQNNQKLTKQSSTVKKYNKEINETPQRVFQNKQQYQKNSKQVVYSKTKTEKSQFTSNKNEQFNLDDLPSIPMIYKQPVPAKTSKQFILANLPQQSNVKVKNTNTYKNSIKSQIQDPKLKQSKILTEEQIQQINLSQIKQITEQLKEIEAKIELNSKIEQGSKINNPTIFIPKTIQNNKKPTENKINKSYQAEQKKSIKSGSIKSSEVSEQPKIIQKNIKNEQKKPDLQTQVNNLKNKLNRIGQTIGRGSKTFKGMKNVNWMLPCFFIYKKFYILRKQMQQRCLEMKVKKSLPAETLNQIKQQNAKVLESLSKMKAACQKKHINNPQILERLKQPVSEDNDEDLDDFVDMYIQECFRPGWSPADHSKILIHLLEMVNSILLIQQIQGCQQAKPLSSQQLFSADIEKNIIVILKKKIKQMKNNR